MKSFVKGLVAGCSITAAALVGYAYGTTSEAEPRGAELQELVRSTCNVRVGYGRMTGGYQCRSNQVMVGMNQGYIFCADVTVTCR